MRAHCIGDTTILELDLAFSEKASILPILSANWKKLSNCKGLYYKIIP